MKKTLRCSLPLVLGLMLGASLAVAGDLGVAVPPAPPSALTAPVCASQPPVQAPTPDDLFTPQPQPAGSCPRISCGDEPFCNQDRDCIAAPGGVCILFCPSKGCCTYPAP